MTGNPGTPAAVSCARSRWTTSDTYAAAAGSAAPMAQTGSYATIEPAGEVPVAVDGRLDLAVHKVRGRGRLPALSLPHAQQRREPGVVRGPDLEGHHGVVLVEVPPAFGMADLHEPDAEFREHGRGHFPGPGPVRPAAVLRAEQQWRTRQEPGRRGQDGEGRNDKRDNPPGREGRTGVHFVPQPLQPVQAVPVAEVHLGADPHQDAGAGGLAAGASAAFVGAFCWIQLMGAGRRGPGGLTAPAARRPCS